MKFVPNGLKNMIILLDTNVVLDILLNRLPWYTNTALIFGLSQQNFIKSYISASSITDIFYITQKEQGKNTAREAIKRLLRVFYPATVTDRDIYQALELEWEYLVTRECQAPESSGVPMVVWFYLIHAKVIFSFLSTISYVGLSSARCHRI